MAIERATNTSARIVSVLRRSRGRHLNAREIYSKIKDQGAPLHLATVYRALQRLTAQGLVKRTSLTQNHAHYELAGNAGVHLLCESCGRLKEMRLACLERAMRSLDRAIGRNFEIRNWQLQVVGRCRHCRRPEDHGR